MHRKSLFLVLILLAGLVMFAGCNSEKETADTETAVAEESHDGHSHDGHGHDGHGHDGHDSDGHNHAPTPPQPPAPQKLAGAHILVMYEGSMRAPAEITRTKEEALELAKEIAAMAKAGDDFAELAKEYSDGPSGPNGGDLGVWQKGRMVPEFDTAILGMDIGGVSDPVETDFGYHVILRKKVEEISARHILVMHNDSMRKPADISRTKDEALARINEVKDKLNKGGDFETLAKEYSDGPSGPNGGDLGPFGKGTMHPAFQEAAFALAVGEISDPVETPFGYHLIQRYK